MEKIKHDMKELRDQLTTYADRITAFSFIQSVAFALAVGNGGAAGLAANVQKHPCMTSTALSLSLVLYCLFLFFCHRSEDGLTDDSLDPSVRNAIKTIRIARFVIIVLAALLSIGITVSTQIE